MSSDSWASLPSEEETHARALTHAPDLTQQPLHERTPPDSGSLCPWTGTADWHLGSDARAIRLARARGSCRSIARCCRHREAGLQVGASRAPAGSGDSGGRCRTGARKPSPGSGTGRGLSGEGERGEPMLVGRPASSSRVGVRVEGHREGIRAHERRYPSAVPSLLFGSVPPNPASGPAEGESEF